jgi:hypothetical protein
MTEEQIENLITEVHETGSMNRLKVSDVRDWLKNYLQMHEEEVARFPQLQREPHWDMIMADYDKSRDGLFICALFQEDVVKMVAGKGGCSEVRDFFERDFPDDPSTILEAIKERCAVGRTQLEMPLQELTSWLA